MEKINTSPWYFDTANRLVPTLATLKEEINCDICVVGAGFTGLSAALELSQKGFSVVLLEADTIAASASGCNGGHLTRGYNLSPLSLSETFGPEAAKIMCNMSLEGLALILERIAKYNIKCDLKFGHVTAALNKGHIKALKRERDQWIKLGHTDLKYINKNDTQLVINSPKYIGGLFDPKGAHFHPLNYALSIAQEAVTAGCKLYDQSKVLSIDKTSPARVVTDQGIVNAKFVLLGGQLDNVKGLGELSKKSIKATAHMIATQPLDIHTVAKILPHNISVTDANFIMNYFRLSSDNRLLFGGGCNYNNLTLPNQAEILKERMVKIFPNLSTTRIDYCWGGPLNITLNRMPHFGRLAPNIFYAYGYAGHGVILSNLAGKLMAEAVTGTAERFDVFSKIDHPPFLGGEALKQPLFVLAMAWYRLRDLLS